MTLPLPAWFPVTNRVALKLPPEDRVTEDGATNHVLHGGLLQNGEGFVERKIVPLNPLMLLSVILELLVKPVGMMSDEGKADIVKSVDGLTDTTSTGMMTLWEIGPVPAVAFGPLVAVTFTL